MQVSPVAGFRAERLPGKPPVSRNPYTGATLSARPVFGWLIRPGHARALNNLMYKRLGHSEHTGELLLCGLPLAPHELNSDLVLIG